MTRADLNACSRSDPAGLTNPCEQFRPLGYRRGACLARPLSSSDMMETYQ